MQRKKVRFYLCISLLLLVFLVFFSGCMTGRLSIPIGHIKHRAHPKADALLEALPAFQAREKASVKVYSAAQVQEWLRYGSKSSTYPHDKKIVFITVDDGPNAKHGMSMIETLRRYNVAATFFYIGGYLPQNENQVKLALEYGNSIGLHSDSHNYRYLYPGRSGNADAVIQDLKVLLQRYQAILGENVAFTVYRYPGGHMSWKNLGEADQRLANFGLTWLDWNVSTGDSVREDSLSVEVIMNNVRGTTERIGDKNVIVLLMHETKAATAEALPHIIEYYSGLGYEFGILDSPKGWHER
ncbi:MAG: polysaccharide deacetylase family protein [Eubacteriaceae bacterium]|nr:polysaccharide deacetylase family protein [Eubacteriaceae bacterium]